MSAFTVRIELHGANEADYQRLHAAMEAQYFSRTITGDNGVRYWLPPAEYRCAGQNNATASSICDQAARVASTIKPSPAVLVTEGGAAWQGLRIVA